MIILQKRYLTREGQSSCSVPGLAGTRYSTLRQKGELAIIHEMALPSANCFSERAASFASLLDSKVMSRIPNPIFLRKGLGGSPPAKI
jgi:hypothetical protein